MRSSSTPDEQLESRRLLIEELERSGKSEPGEDDLGVVAPEVLLPGDSESPAGRRRFRGRPVSKGVQRVTLRQMDGVFIWEPSSTPVTSSGQRRFRARQRNREGEFVVTRKFETLLPSKITEFLLKFDRKLNPCCIDANGAPAYQLRELDPNWNPTPLRSRIPVEPEKKILLFIHGTFSKSEAILTQLKSIPEGLQFLTKARQEYDALLTFEHPTLSGSPFINAVDLARAFDGSAANIDVVCHSRGGLVTRWWFENLAPRHPSSRRAILVGCPLAGTSLAGAPQLRSAIDFYTNVFAVLGQGAAATSTLFPIMTVVQGMLRLIGSLTSLAAKTPLADAVIAMIPGIAGQSRVGNNQEILRLRQNPYPLKGTDYFSVTSDFQPVDNKWAFWKYFCRPKSRFASLAVDPIFLGPNDLVVDTDCMTNLTDADELKGNALVYSFQKNATVHHLNYFSQPSTIKFIMDSLKLGP